MKSLLTFVILLFSMTANATYCSLTTPQYCPPNTGSTNNLTTNSNLTSDSGALAIGQGGDGGNASAQGGQGIGTANGYGGQSVTKIQNVGNSSTNVPRQAPMAYAPSIQLGANAFNCSNSASFGASSPFGGVSLGIPLTADNCPTFVMSQYLYSIGQPVQGCEILNNIPEIADVRKKTNFSCVPVAVVNPLVHDKSWLDNFNKRFPPINSKLDSIHTQQMRK
jgi:hypothetical protein